MRQDGFSYGKKGKALAIVIVATVSFLGLVPLVSALMGGYGFMWSVLPDEPVTLDVCWENPSPADATAREWVRLALKRSWERYARVIFVGWDECENEENAADPPHTYGPRRPGKVDENIKIEIRNTGGGQNPAHGSWGDYEQHGLWLNLYCGSRTCVEHLAIHEFGHALGYYHGEERKDWNIPGCDEQWSSYPPSIPPWWPVPTEKRYGDPDPDSVMAYCSGWSTELSPKDITGAQRYYQRHLPGTVLSAVASLCLAAHANDLDNGERAFGWACDEAHDDQEWIYDRIKQSLHIQWPYAPLPPRCLDVDTNNYSRVQAWDCHYGANQQWQFRRVLLKGYGDLCLTRSLAGPGPVTMEECAGTDNQLWRLESGGLPGFMRFRAENRYLCLATTGGVGSTVVAETCYGTHQIYLPLVLAGGGNRSSMPETGTDTGTRRVTAGGQDFYLRPGGQIRLASVGGGSSLCLDVHDVWNQQFVSGQGGPAPGQRVQVFDCYDSQLNQHWNLTGDIVSVNKCLTLIDDNTANGAKAAVSRCDGSLDQDWDYYW
jgi:hypothetical protein